MDAFAARQLHKKKIASEKKRLEDEQNDKPTEEKMSWEERIQFNKIFGVLDPPTNCLAVGLDVMKYRAYWTLIS